MSLTVRLYTPAELKRNEKKMSFFSYETHFNAFLLLLALIKAKIPNNTNKISDVIFQKDNPNDFTLLFP